MLLNAELLIKLKLNPSRTIGFDLPLPRTDGSLLMVSAPTWSLRHLDVLVQHSHGLHISPFVQHAIIEIKLVCFRSQFSKERFIREGVNGNVHKILNLDNGDEKGGGSHRGRRSRISRTATSVDVNGVEQSKMQFDSTGMLHSCLFF